MDRRRFGILLPAAGLSLVVNMILFSLLPSFGQKVPQRAGLEDSIPIPVNVIQFKRQKPVRSVEDREKPMKELRSTPEKKIPVVKLRFTQKAIPRKPRPQLDMPRLTFKINPMLNIGMEVSPPPPLPKEPPYHRPGIPSTFSGISPPASPLPGGRIVRRGHGGAYLEGELDQVPVVIFRKKPFYPFRARARNISGEVKVKFLVDTNGNVSRIRILQSNPTEVFDKSVVDAVSLWRFLPGKLHGQAVPTWVITTIKFKLEG